MSLAFTWWGHATATVELGGVRVVTDPLLGDRLRHLRRFAPSPGPRAYDADLVLVSHLHHDHLHRPSLRRFAAEVPVVLPQGAEWLLPDSRRALPVGPGDELEVAGVRVTVLPASHDHRRGSFSRATGHPVGYRVEADGTSFWFPGDTALRPDMADVAPVHLALVPVGGWGPTLGAGHMDPDDAAVAVDRVGARIAVPVHWGTFWPVGLRRLAPANHERLFVTPGRRFAAALARSPAAVLLPGHGERVTLA